MVPLAAPIGNAECPRSPGEPWRRDYTGPSSTWHVLHPCRGQNSCEAKALPFLRSEYLVKRITPLVTCSCCFLPFWTGACWEVGSGKVPGFYRHGNNWLFRGGCLLQCPLVHAGSRGCASTYQTLYAEH